MSDQENELKKALAENGSFDAEKAKRLGSDVGAEFHARLKRAERRLSLSTIITVVVLEFAFVGFWFSFSTKSLIGFAILLVVVAVIAGALAIERSIANTKISLLKEMKLMRLERLGLPSDDITSAARKSAVAGTSLWSALSSRENVAWLLALILAAAASIAVAVWLWLPGGTLTDESQVTLLADGSGSEVSKVSYPYFGWYPMTSSSVWTGLGPYTITHWIDSQGRELPITVSTIGGKRQYTVELAEPVMPGEQVRDTRIGESPKMAEEEGGLWTCRRDPMSVYRKNMYLVTIQLPKGAEIVSVDPKPAQQFVRDGLPTVRFQAIRDRNQKFEYTIQYRLPEEITPPETTK